MSNLPNWHGASVCYSRAYALLEQMAQAGHVTRRKIGRRFTCYVSPEMAAIIDALNTGNEESIKATLLYQTHTTPKNNTH